MTRRFNASGWLVLVGWLCIGAAEADGQSQTRISPPAVQKPATEKLLAFVGTYTRGRSEGIYSLEMDLKSGALKRLEAVSGITNPSFLAVHPSRRFLYAVAEVGSRAAGDHGAVVAFAIDSKTGALSRLNQQSSQGVGPCHLVVDRTGKNVLVANYAGGSVAVLPIGEDGKLRPASSFIQHTGSSIHARQSAPHAHGIYLDAAGRFAFVPDLGLDKILVYRFDATKGTLTPHDVPWASVSPGSGPRHFAFDPTGRYAYVINELSSTVAGFSYDAPHGTLDSFQTVSTLPKGFDETNSTAEIHVAPSGKILYGSNRGHDSIAIFAIDEATGRLRLTGHEPTQGQVPRYFGIDPTGTYLLAANQKSDTIVVFRIDPTTGSLKPTGRSVSVPMPVCIQMIPKPAG